MTIEQLQKPNVAAKLVNKFALTLPVSDRTLNRVPAAGRRGRLADGGSSTSGGLDPRGLTVTKADELVVANAGDESVLLYDVEGRLVRRIDQRHLLRSRVQRVNDQNDEAARAAAADKLDSNKLVSAFLPQIVSWFLRPSLCCMYLSPITWLMVSAVYRRRLSTLERQ